MIRLKKNTYRILNLSEDRFWEKIDSITVGQNINPEISYTTPFFGNFDNVFAGRKIKNKFSLYLYRPLTSGFRTEILAKGEVNSDTSNNSLIINCSFEIPFWSLLMFTLLGSLIIIPCYFLSFTAGIIVNFICLLFYGLIINSNWNDIDSELYNQLSMMGTVKIENMK